MNFKKIHNEKDRKEEFDRIQSKYAERIPIIVETNPRSKDLPKLSKNKFLVPRSITFGQFMYIIRSRMKLKQEQALFIFVNNILPTNSQTVQEIYQQHKDEDGFLYCLITAENTFG